MSDLEAYFTADAPLMINSINSRELSTTTSKRDGGLHLRLNT